jgi:hypothetical protein
MRRIFVNTHLEVIELDPGTFEVKAVQGHIVTQHSIGADPEFRDELGLGTVAGTTLVREVVEILLEHEALAAVPADTRLEQLVSHYPYLSSELQQRLSSEAVDSPVAEPPRISALPAEDHPTHT